jgi:hydroxymethylbilane synthase
MNRVRIAIVDDPLGHAHLAHVACRLGLALQAPSLVRILDRPEADRGRALSRLARQVISDDADAVLWPASALPLRVPTGLALAAVVRSGHYGFRLVGRAGSAPRALAELRPGSRVATTDPVARAQMLYRFPGLAVELVSTSVNTVPEIASGRWDAACVASELLDLGAPPHLEPHVILIDDLVPPVGQGSVAVLVADGRSETAQAFAAVSDLAEAASLAVERAFLEAVGGLEGTVATARAMVARGRLDLTGVLAGENGEWLVLDGATAPATRGNSTAGDVADACRALARCELARRYPKDEAVGTATRQGRDRMP